MVGGFEGVGEGEELEVVGDGFWEAVVGEAVPEGFA